jgi:RecB family exonuclease
MATCHAIRVQRQSSARAVAGLQQQFFREIYALTTGRRWVFRQALVRIARKLRADPTMGEMW